MATTVEDLSVWFDEGVKLGATRMIVVCDTFDWSDYPVYTREENFWEEYASHDNKNMQKIMEVYDLRASKLEQLKGTTRVNRLPKPTGSVSDSAPLLAPDK